MKRLMNVAIISAMCMVTAISLVMLSSFDKNKKEKAYIFTESEAAYLITTINEAKQIIIHSNEVPIHTSVEMINRIDSISRIIVKQMDNKDSIEVK